jgi:hypothetical protein
LIGFVFCLLRAYLRALCAALNLPFSNPKRAPKSIARDQNLYFPCPQSFKICDPENRNSPMLLSNWKEVVRTTRAAHNSFLAGQQALQY